MRKFKKSRKRLNAQGTSRWEGRPAGKTRKSKTAWVGVFIAAIMVLSVIGYMWTGNEIPELEYNGHDFIMAQDRFFEMDYNKNKMRFYHHPSELEYLEIGSSGTELLSRARMVYSTLDTDDPLIQAIGIAQYDIMKALQLKNSYFVYAFTSENEFNKTIITCHNATASAPVIYLRKGNETKISYDNGCFEASAETEYRMAAIRDRIIYSILGVMQ